MTEDLAERIIRTFLAEGGSVCPFAKTSPLLFFRSNVDPVPILQAFVEGQAIIIFTPRRLGGFAATKEWARQSLMAAMIAAAVASNPGLAPRKAAELVARDVKPALYDERPTTLRPNIALNDKAVISICMAPCYPQSHPRYAPVPLLVLTWLSDIEKAGTLPKVRAAMEREHGFVYDALELVVPLPSKN